MDNCNKYRNKYLKYKKKYIELKQLKQLKGGYSKLNIDRKTQTFEKNKYRK